MSETRYTGWGNDGEINPARSFSLSCYLGTSRKFRPGWNYKTLMGYALLHPLFLGRRGKGVEGGGGGGGAGRGAGGLGTVRSRTQTYVWSTGRHSVKE